MSVELKNFLEKEILPTFDNNSKTLAPHIQEEYLTPEGWLDKAYICKKLKLHLSTATFRKVVKQTLNCVQFRTQYVDSEVSMEEFKEHYTFGKFYSMRSWVGYMYIVTGKVVTREDVFKWITTG